MAPTPHTHHRLHRARCLWLHRGGMPYAPPEDLVRDVVVDCGWGRLIFGQTFVDESSIAQVLQAERKGQRDIALYMRDPHVVMAIAPQEVFLDPSHTFRLWLDRYRVSRLRPSGFYLRRLIHLEDAEALQQIYLKRHMVPPPSRFAWLKRASPVLTQLVAVDEETGAIIAGVLGVDHVAAFSDPEQGASLWALATDPQSSRAGVGEALVRALAEHYQARGRAFLDLSVLHDNHHAIALYKRLGFVRVPVFAVKRKNSWNEPLYTGPQPDAELNPYARIIVDEARRRGIGMEVLDEQANYFSLIYGGRTIVCRESLSELTTAVAMSRCDDKAVTRRLLVQAGLKVPDQRPAGRETEELAFLANYQRIVVKPARGEQGMGISVDIRTPEELRRAISEAKRFCERVLLEAFVEGQDLRIVVIGFKVVAAAIRRPATIRGNGRHTVRELIEKQSQRRAAATGGESRIPLDGETERCLRAAGFAWDSVLAEGQDLAVRKTANLHTGGTIHDVTPILSHTLCRAAVAAARAIDIPVVGLDFLVPSPEGRDYVIIEANERPGLANHEPQPTAERFVDLLFPQTAWRTRSIAAGL